MFYLVLDVKDNPGAIEAFTDDYDARVYSMEVNGCKDLKEAEQYVAALKTMDEEVSA